MKKRLGIINLVTDLRKHIAKDRAKYAYFQTLGKIENLITYELAEVARNKYHTLSLVNCGNKGERKYDVMFYNPKNLKLEENRNGSDYSSYPEKASTVIELKYINNVHRSSSYDATDNISKDISTLSKQMKINKMKQGGIPIALSSRTKSVYGIVITSFVHNDKFSSEKVRHNKAAFDKRIIETLDHFGLYYVDTISKKSVTAYDEQEIQLGKETYRATLRFYLVWKPSYYKADIKKAA